MKKFILSFRKCLVLGLFLFLSNNLFGQNSLESNIFNENAIHSVDEKIKTNENKDCKLVSKIEVINNIFYDLTINKNDSKLVDTTKFFTLKIKYYLC